MKYDYSRYCQVCKKNVKHYNIHINSIIHKKLVEQMIKPFVDCVKLLVSEKYNHDDVNKITDHIFKSKNIYDIDDEVINLLI
jgi:PBP1b-binding outer membrane lipoprotein LpoB